MCPDRPRAPAIVLMRYAGSAGLLVSSSISSHAPQLSSRLSAMHLLSYQYQKQIQNQLAPNVGRPNGVVPRPKVRNFYQSALGDH
uniref:GG11416 n=1 Tax=Drosophila erecta TaxID=7220 RepID=B3P6H2_DROER